MAVPDLKALGLLCNLKVIPVSLTGSICRSPMKRRVCQSDQSMLRTESGDLVGKSRDCPTLILTGQTFML